MKKGILSISTCIVILLFCTSTALPWGSAAHAYIAVNMGKELGLENVNKIYGAMLPDLFNYAFSLPNQQMFQDLTHGTPGMETFMNVWMSAATPMQMALGYGFLSHNDVWAADYTAHWDARTLRESQEYDLGYIETKSYELEDILDLTNTFGVPYEVAIELNHNILETAGDVIIMRMDAEIGQKIMAAATNRSSDCPTLLINAYGSYDPAIPSIVPLVEAEFQTMMIQYGFALSQDEATAVYMLSFQLAALAYDYLEPYGIPLPPIDELTEIVVGYMGEAIFLMEQDFMREIRATIGFVQSQLANHHIFY